MSSHLPVPPTPPALPAAAPHPRPLGVAPGAAGGEVSRLAAALLRYRWLLLAALVAGVGAGLAGARWVHPVYSAQGTVWIEATDRAAVNQGPIRSGELLRSYAWVELLKSYTVLDSVIHEQRLYLAPGGPADAAALAGFRLGERPAPGAYRLEVGPQGRGWTLSSAEGRALERGRVGAPVGAAVGFDWTPPASALPAGTVVSFTVRNPRDVALGLSESLDARMADNGHFLRLSLTGGDPQALAGTLNATMERYVEVAAQLKRAKLDELTGILEEQRRLAESNLRDAEVDLESFRVRTVTLPSDQGAPVAPGLQLTQDPVFSSYFGLKVTREDLRRDRLALERLLGQAGAGEVGFDALSVIPAVQQSPEVARLLAERTERRAELRSLRRRYTDEHATVRRAVADLQTLETSAIPAAVGQLAAQLRGREAEVEGRIASASTELREIPPRAIEEARLERRVEVAANLYGTLRQRYEEARLAAVSSLPDLRILDRAAVPTAPVQDRRPLVVAGGTAAMLGLALLGVLLLDRADRRVRFPEQISGRMGLPVLGMVPTAPPGFAATGEDGVRIAEAFRELRLGVVHAHGTAGPLVLAVTSPESGEGKSTVASCLARAFAGQGNRTVLVDGDIRRGDLHRLLSGYRAPGLTDCLDGRSTLTQALQIPEGQSFAFLASGTRMREGPELLGSPAMQQTMGELRARFDVVVVDTPPLTAGADAYVLGTVAGNLLMVLRTGRTDGALAEAKLDVLDRLPVRVLGAVLNAVPPMRAYRYYSYLSGYAAEDESPRLPAGSAAQAG